MSRICRDELSLEYDKDLSYPIVDSPFYKVVLRDIGVRSRYENQPDYFITEENSGDCSTSTSGVERKVTLKNRDPGGGTSGGYIGLVNGNNVSEGRYVLKIHKDACGDTNYARQKFCTDLLTRDLHDLEKYSPTKLQEAPIKGTLCRMPHRNDPNVFLIIEITRNHKDLPYGPYSPDGTNIYPTNKPHPGLITELTTAPGTDFQFAQGDWQSDELYAAEDIYDPFKESAQYKILAYGAIYEQKIRPTMTMRLHAYNNWQDKWQQYMYRNTGGKQIGADPECTKWFKKDYTMLEGDCFFVSIDKEQNFENFYSEVDPKSTPPNYDSCSTYIEHSGTAWSHEKQPNSDIVVTWSINKNGWKVDDDGLQNSIGVLSSEFQNPGEIGESIQEIQQLRWFLYKTRDEIISTSREKFAKACPDINLREEFLTVGDRGNYVAVVTEQLQNLGLKIEDRYTFTANTYENIISLKKYMKKLDLEFYEYLEIDKPCGVPPDCVCDQNQCNTCSTDYPECKSNSGSECGCVTYGTFAFIIEYQQRPEPNISTKWKNNLPEFGLDSVFSNCSPKKYVQDVNSPFLMLGASKSLSLKVKKGWELKLSVTAYDYNGAQITDNWGVTEKYLWLLGGDEIIFNSQKAKERGWPTRRELDNLPYKSPIYHLVSKVNDKQETAPNGVNYSTNQNSQIPMDAPAGTDPINILTGVPEVIESKYSGVSFKIGIVDIRAPFSEWSIHEDSMPPGWGVEYGASAMTKFGRDLAKSFTGELSLEIGVYTGLQLSLLSLINFDAGLLARYKFTKASSSAGEHQISYGYSYSAEADFGDIVSASWKNQTTYPYTLEATTIPSDICYSILHLIHRLLVYNGNSDGLNEYDYDFSRIETQMKPVQNIKQVNANLFGKKVSGKWQKETFGSNELDTEIEVTMEDEDNNKVGLVVKDLVKGGVKQESGTIEIIFGKTTEKINTLTDLVDTFTSDEVFDFEKVKEFVLIDNTTIEPDFWGASEVVSTDYVKVDRRVKMLEKIENASSFVSINPSKLTPMVTNRAFFTLGMEWGYKVTISEVPMVNLEQIVAGMAVIPLSTTGPFNDALSALVWVGTYLSSADPEKMKLSIGIYGEAAADVNKSILLFSVWGVIYLNLILKVDAKIAVKADLDISNLIITSTKYLGKAATIASIIALTSKLATSALYIQTMLLSQVPSCEEIESHEIVNNQLKLGFSQTTNLSGFKVGDIVEIVGAKNPIYDQQLDIAMKDIGTNSKSLTMKPINGALNLEPNWSGNKRVLRVG